MFKNEIERYEKRTLYASAISSFMESKIQVFYSSSPIDSHNYGIDKLLHLHSENKSCFINGNKEFLFVEK